MKKMSTRSMISVALATALMAGAPAAQADAVADYYKGKNLKILIGYGAGGGYDTTTRIFAHHRAPEYAGRG
jgi:tripartite-type tricarboxylate transporter receptor subunit TctC